MAIDRSKITPFPDALKAEEERLVQMVKECQGDNESRCAAELALAIRPVWLRWVKESCGTSPDLLLAAVKIFAGLLTEAIMNTAKEGEENAVAMAIGKLIDVTIVSATKKIVDEGGEAAGGAIFTRKAN